MKKIILPFLILLFIFSESILSAQENYLLNKIKFTGNDQFSNARLSDQINMKQNSVWRNILFWKKKHRFQQADLKIDLQNLIAFYQKEGFLQVQIEPQLLIDEDNETVELILKIEENQPVIVSAIIYDIQAADSIRQELDLLLPKIKKKNNLKKDNRFRDKDLLQGQKMLLDKLQNSGFPFCEINFDLNLTESQDSVSVKFQVLPNGKMKYGKIEIRGNQKVQEKFIKDQITFEIGEIFHPKDLQKTQRRIQNLNMFKFTTLQVEPWEEADNAVKVLINVEEAPRLTTRLAVGYGLEERFRTELNITKLGFLGGIRKVVFIARHTYLEPYKISFDLTQPAVLHPRGSITFNPFILKKNEEGYDIESIGIYWLYRLAHAQFSSVLFDYNYEWNNLIAKSDFSEEQLAAKGEENYQLSSFSLGYQFNNSEPILSPASGWFFGSSAALSGFWFYSDYHYYQVHTEVRKYTSLAANTVLALRLEYGVMKPTRKDELTPLAERFYSGGKSSVRGWKRSELGPLNEEGVPKGGNSLLETSAEIRFPLYKILSGIIFLDAGNVWSESYRHDVNDLRYAAGAGLRFKTPLGSIRIEAAYPVFEADLPLQYYLSIGESF